jgi:cbb3-type cytochrome oxidase subunit 3
MAAAARMEGGQGDHARRSPIRKAYLYLALFAGVIGSIVSAWRSLSPLFNAWFGSVQPDWTQAALRNLAYLVIFLIFLAYHWAALRADGRAAAQALASHQAQYSVLILAPGAHFLQAVHSRAAPIIACAGDG